MNKAEAREAVVKALDKAVDALNNSAISSLLKDTSADVPLVDAGLDSMDEVAFCIELEVLAGVDIEPAELTRFDTVNALAAFIAQRTGGAA